VAQWSVNAPGDIKKDMLLEVMVPLVENRRAGSMAVGDTLAISTATTVYEGKVLTCEGGKATVQVGKNVVSLAETTGTPLTKSELPIDLWRIVGVE
jgi:hypothetical protein